jgi:hypothetical protein
MSTIDWKRGDSFLVEELGMLKPDPDGTLKMIVNGEEVPASALDMTGWAVASQIRRKDSDELVCDLEFAWVNQVQGSYRLQAKDTSAWPLAMLSWDVQFTNPDGFISSSETMFIRCKKDQTRAA